MVRIPPQERILPHSAHPMDRIHSPLPESPAERLGTIDSININKEMRGSYLNYAMSVIVARALPDARDGLKPVHRRILYAMHDMGLRPGSGYKKSARLVGEVLGKYHPHGDQAVYDAMARMAQDFSLRYPLVDGQGNFGSQDGDKPAAMRYTEVRLASIASEMLSDINMDTVDFTENYDSTQEEPAVLPARLPNLLLNGASGIAVGMATNIPPHNLGELVDAIVYLIDHYDRMHEVTVEDLMQFVQGPDFPTGATLLKGIGDTKKQIGLEAAYAQGKGRIYVRAEYEIEDSGSTKRLVFTAIPYQTSKPAIIERIVGLVRSGRIDTIRDLRDESNRRGMRLVVELKNHAQPQRVLSQLYTYTQLQTAYNIQMMALVNGEPRQRGLKFYLQVYIEHRYQVIVRRSQHDLARQRARAHVLSGLLKAVAAIDTVIQLIRRSPDAESARLQLMVRLELDEVQARAILDMQLRRLAALERQKLQDEYDEVQTRIDYLEALLASPADIRALIRADLLQIAEKYGDERRSTITVGNPDTDEGDLHRSENVVITLTEKGYIKRVAERDYHAQLRGGRGRRGITLAPDDTLLDIFHANSHDDLLLFSDYGKVYSCKAYEITVSKRDARGIKQRGILPAMAEDETITAVVAWDKEKMRGRSGYFFMATVKGRVKRVQHEAFMDIRSNGLIAAHVREGDRLRWVKWTNGSQKIVMASADGQSILFHEDDVRAMGRQASGVIGMKLLDGDCIAGMDVVTGDAATVLILTRNGYGKRSPVSEYRCQSRYGIGTRTLRRNDRTGPVIAVRCVHAEDGIVLISKEGTVLRTDLSQIREVGRNTQGVRVMSPDDGDKVAGVALLRAQPSGQEPVDTASKNGTSATATG